VRIDHVIYGTADLDLAAARVEAELGLSAVAGGHHEGLGTHNRIVPLHDGSYIELLAVADPDEAEGSAIGAALQAAIARGQGLLGWAVAVEDLAPIAARLGTPITGVRRQGLSARLTGVQESLAEPFLPFFIERPAAGGSAVGPNDAREISWIEVAGDGGRLERWLAGAALPVRVVDGEPAVRAISVSGRELRTR
jgi:hypothetical protein